MLNRRDLNWALLVVLGIVVATTGTASAACVGCEQISCTKFNGQTVDAFACGSEITDNGPGIQNCKTVRGCGGCIGFSCYRQGEVPLNVILDPETTVVQSGPQRDAATVQQESLKR